MVLKPLSSRSLANTFKNACSRAAVGTFSATSTSSVAPSTASVAFRAVGTTSIFQQRYTDEYSSTRFVATPQSHYRRWLSDDANKEASGTAEEKEDDAKTTEEAASEAEEAAEDDGQSETDKLKEEVTEMKNQLLRSLAEQENIRSIARRDVEAAKNFSVKSFAKSMLEVADNLDRALDSVDQEEASKNDTLKTFLEGIEMTGNGLVKALKSNGVTPFCEEPGDEFDAEKHQALMEYEDPKATPGTVGVVMKKGYMLNGRVLRAAEVGVIKK